MFFLVLSMCLSSVNKTNETDTDEKMDELFSAFESSKKNEKSEEMRRRMDSYHWEERRAICVGKNTVAGSSECWCERGYFGNKETINTTGCWKCEPGCNKLADCVSENKCVCKMHLEGDGIKECKAPKPKLLSIKQISDRREPVLVDVEYETSSFTPFSFFCKFGSVVSSGKIIDEKHASCITPKNVNGKVKLTISFDGETYSNELDYNVVHGKYSIYYVDDEEKERSYMLSIVSFALFAITCIVYIIMIRRKGKYANKSENESLLKNSRSQKAKKAWTSNDL